MSRAENYRYAKISGGVELDSLNNNARSVFTPHKFHKLR